MMSAKAIVESMVLVNTSSVAWSGERDWPMMRVVKKARARAVYGAIISALEDSLLVLGKMV